MKHRILVSMLVVAMAAAMIGGATFAWFTDRGSAVSSEFEAGKLSIDIDEGPAEIEFQFAKMQPGDETGVYEIEITNDGTLDLAMWRKFNIVGSDHLAKNLVVTTYKVRDFSTIPKYPESDGWLDMIEHGHWDDGTRWDHDGDGKVTLYDLVNRDDQYGNGWFGIGLAPGSIYEFQIGFEFYPEAGNALMNKSVSMSMDIIATQINATAMEHELGDDGPTTSYETLESTFKGHLGRQ